MKTNPISPKDWVVYWLKYLKWSIVVYFFPSIKDETTPITDPNRKTLMPYPVSVI